MENSFWIVVLTCVLAVTVILLIKIATFRNPKYSLEAENGLTDSSLVKPGKRPKAISNKHGAKKKKNIKKPAVAERKGDQLLSEEPPGYTPAQSNDEEPLLFLMTSSKTETQQKPLKEPSSEKNDKSIAVSTEKSEAASFELENGWVAVAKKGEASAQSLQRKLAKLEEENEELRKSYKSVSDSCDALLQKSISCEKEHRAKMGVAASRIKGLEGELSAISERNSSMYRTLSESREKEGKLEAMLADHNLLLEFKADAIKEKESFLKNKSEMSIQIKELEEKLHSTQKQLDETSAVCSSLTAQANDLKNRNQNLSESLDGSAAALKVLEVDLKNTQTEKQQISGRLEELKVENSKMQSQNEHLTKELAEKEVSYTAKITDFTDLLNNNKLKMAKFDEELKEKEKDYIEIKESLSRENSLLKEQLALKSVVPKSSLNSEVLAESNARLLEYNEALLQLFVSSHESSAA